MLEQRHAPELSKVQGVLGGGVGTGGLGVGGGNALGGGAGAAAGGGGGFGGAFAQTQSILQAPLAQVPSFGALVKLVK